MDKDIQYKLVEEAPCFWCGYNGPGFFQTKTHEKYCPWYNIGGGEERKDSLLTVVEKHWGYRKRLYIPPIDINDFYKEEDKCTPQVDLYKPFCFGRVYASFHDCEPCPVFDSCEMKALTEEL